MTVHTPIEKLDPADAKVRRELKTLLHPARGRRAAWVGAFLVLIVGAWWLLRDGAPPAAAAPAPVLTVAAPLARDVTLWDEYIGRFEASKAVEVRPRVSGAITGIHFTDGQIVRQGQPLFTIDPRPYRAALSEARASAASARSDLALARLELERASRLVDVEAVSQSEIDRLRARVNAANAALAGADARIAARALDVEFTTVRAPLSGRISDRQIDAGNLVSAGDAGGTLLTTINALDPVYFTFQGSEALFLKTKREGGDKGAAVEVRLQDESDYRWKGQLDFTDNGLDPRSGTIRARASFRNPEMFLTPGMFGNMRLSTGQTARALLVPAAAVQTDQARKIVYVVGKDGMVAAKPVEIGPEVDGLRVIRSGLTPTDQIVINGYQFARPGTKAVTKVGKIAAAAPKQGAAAAAEPVSAQATFAK
ncbi:MULTISPECIES: efflux RND transporter periplasmic adaptor subunit [unclassified Sphingopyxis]|jgi:RND family efflux transporter MFP subunit|uniref:efflux RND transporter periplasmic adaptor subunit n=1 Tax=unclassified Sphingopyxis TaxID=2614943 RepID=UPI0006BED8A4|nr:MULTISPECIES: efflux RND transporter periplasmic adaptor subunit [unclassified Sphingopyxis]USI77287.1 efflux RND transporter periplasmic adaptor subunit [Sphingopyxis sp. USTB-05]GAO80242.1 probable Co/Zn/Cd efflux system membrane fusion protein [Sphingopyxis sp. C-1]